MNGIFFAYLRSESDVLINNSKNTISMLKKSVLLIAFCGLFGLLSAQSLRFGLNGMYFENNEVLICDQAPNAEDWMTEMIQEMTVYNLTANPLNVLISKEEVKVVEGTANSFCWGSCYSPVVMESPVAMEIAPYSYSPEGQLSFHYNLDPEGASFDSDGNINTALWPAGTTIIRYYAYPERDPEDRICLEVWFAYNATNVPEVVASFGKAYPNPAVNTVRFDLQGSAQQTVKAVLYNLLGQEVKSQTVNGAQDKIEFNVSDLQEGIYFCSFFVNNAMVKTDKFIVKR